MNNEIYSRLEALMKSLGFSVNSGGITKAEIKAYAAGISLACDFMDNLLKNLFADTADFKGLAMFLNLINESSQETEEQARKLIYTAFSEKGGGFRLSDFEKALSETGSNAAYSVNGSFLVLSFAESAGRDFMERLGGFIKYNAPAGSVLMLDGNGLTFSGRDSLELCWYVLDGFGLPFSVIDTLKQ